ncbi:MAG: alcohol acetyltransferase [Chloroflexi bacterium]|nr:alcohol acetyltransferase [Chloroflexota bacterium]
MVTKNQSKARSYFRFDNAAHIYPAIKNRKQPGVFRVSATLTDPIDPQVLRQALNKTMKRIPGFSVKLRKGLFWNYFIHSEDELPIQPDVLNPCMEITRKENDGFLLRVRYHQCRIALEIFHALADGSGAMIFLKTLVAEYLKQMGHPIPTGNGVLDCAESAKPEEMADSFRPFAGGAHILKREEPRAYQITGDPIPTHDVILTRGTVPVEDMRKLAKSLDASITEYLTAMLLYIINCQQMQAPPHRLLPVRVQVPVNLRAFFNTETLRNFSSFINVGLEPRLGDFTFEEIVCQVHNYLRYEVNEKLLRSRVAANLRTESIPFLRIVPLFLKTPMISLGYKLAGPNTFSSIISNLGNVEMPEEMEKHTQRFDFILGASNDTKVKCAVAGFKGNLSIIFTRSIKEADIERAFFTFLVEQGIPVEIESNQE